MTTPHGINPVRAFDPVGQPSGQPRRDPQSRYVLPSFVERTSYGVKEMNP